VRALEVYYVTGVPISRHQENHGFAKERYPTLFMGLAVERSDLNARIDIRVDEMMARGLAAEVEGLLARGYGLDLPAMGALGYRHMGMVLRGAVDMDEAIRLMKRDTRRFAKRQMTWFRSMHEVRWFRSEEHAIVLEEARCFLRKTRNMLDISSEYC
jgi:tRNA dimethylallyltransferase